VCLHVRGWIFYRLCLFSKDYWVIVIFGFIVRGSLDEIQGFLLFLILTYICV